PAILALKRQENESWARRAETGRRRRSRASRRRAALTPIGGKTFNGIMPGPDDRQAKANTEADTAPKKPLTPAAERALAEAAARRADVDRRAAERPKEVGGGAGPEPTRYGDWERKGIASDF